MPDFQNNKERVKYLLENYPDTRNSDLKLYLMYCQEFTNYNLKKLTMNEFLTNHDSYLDIPNTKTLYRNRCKLQREYPELMPSDEVIAIRRHLRDQYRDYYR